MSQFLYFRRGECPVCQGARRDLDCRQSTTSGIVFCRGTDTAPNGWGFIGEDRNGFSMWAQGDRSQTQ